LFILVDDQSPQDLKMYNPRSTLTTPNLDRLAAEGMVFDGAYHMGSSLGAVCTPSRHMIMSGRTVEAEEALRIGLANRLVEDEPLAAGLAFAREMTGYSLPVLALAREAVQRALDLPVHEGLKIEADLSTLAYQTHDADEGMQAFIDKRKPVFGDV
jgi:enoyl-CoA hydratase/carnithine racemase